VCAAVHPDSEDAPRVYRILRGDAVAVEDSPFGAVGAVFSGSGIEVVWVSKGDEEIDPGWFVSEYTDVLVVLQGQLKVEFESPAYEDRVLDPGDALVLPAGCRCRAYRWPRTAEQATVFLAAYPARAAGR
jgi:uncharacterized protein YjlB